MKWRSVLGFGLLGGLVSILAFDLLFPTILNSGLLFGGLVALLLVGGFVLAVISARRMYRR